MKKYPLTYICIFIEVLNMYSPWGCRLGLGFRHRYGWFYKPRKFGGWTWWCPRHRTDKESLDAYRKWLEEEMKLVDEALKKEKSEEQKA